MPTRCAPYVRLIHDVLIGDRSLFTRPDGLASAWDVLEPVLNNRPPVQSVRAGQLGTRRRRRTGRPGPLVAGSVSPLASGKGPLRAAGSAATWHDEPRHAPLSASTVIDRPISGALAATTDQRGAIDRTPGRPPDIQERAVTTSGTPTPPNQFTPPGSTGASIPLVAEPAVDRTASMGALVKDVTTHMSTLVRSEIELAKLEITETVKTGATGGAFFGVAAVIGAFSMWFFFFMLGEILAIWLPRWVAFTIVFVLMLVLAGLFAFLGLRKVKKIKKPEKTIASLEQTAAALKSAATS